MFQGNVAGYYSHSARGIGQKKPRGTSSNCRRSRFYSLRWGKENGSVDFLSVVGCGSGGDMVVLLLPAAAAAVLIRVPFLVLVRPAGCPGVSVVLCVCWWQSSWWWWTGGAAADLGATGAAGDSFGSYDTWMMMLTHE